MGVFRQFFQLGNIERMLAQVTFLTLMCIIIRTKRYVKIVLEQSRAIYYQRQSMKEKWQYFQFFFIYLFFLAKLQEFAHFCDVIEIQLSDNDD